MVEEEPPGLHVCFLPLDALRGEFTAPSAMLVDTYFTVGRLQSLQLDRQPVAIPCRPKPKQQEKHLTERGGREASCSEQRYL